MSSLRRRLDSLGDYLAPIEIFLRWLREVARFPSLHDYLASLKGAPDSAWPLFRLPDEADRAATSATKGMPRRTAQNKVREDVRDVVFLWHLHSNVNARISDEVRSASPNIALLFADLVRRFREQQHRSGALDAWMRACRDLPYPLDADTAATVEAALAHRVESWTLLREAETIEDWVLDELETADVDEVPEESLAKTSRKVERGLKRLVRSGEVRAGKLVSVPSVPHPFLSSAPLLDGRWIDVVVLELAELGAILEDRGYALRGSRDLHSLAWEQFVRTDEHGHDSPTDDASWLDAREAATDRVHTYRGRRRVIDGRDYVNLSLYQKWRSRKLGSRLEASTELGFVVSTWNDWVEKQGPNAVLADVRLQPLEHLVDADAWTVHDAVSARRLQTTRASLLADLRSSPRDADVDEIRFRWRDRAEYFLVLVDALTVAVDRIRSTHFRNAEILFPNCSADLERCREDIRKAIEFFDALRTWDDPWSARFGSQTLPEDDDNPDDQQEEEHRKRIEDRIARTAARIARDLLLQARVEALAFIGEKNAARDLIDQELDELFS